VPRSTVSLSFDFDALSVWFGFERTTPAMLNRGEYGARVGVPRVLDLLGRHEIEATFFVPGHTVESFPRETETILERGHELAHHSYAHVDPSQQSREEEEADMERALGAFERIGVRPLGYRSPSADLSASTLKLVEGHGFVYDSSLMTDDFRPFHPRIGDQVSRDEPLVRGRESTLWELPMSFELDDWPHFQFSFDPPRSGLSAPSAVLEIWQGELEWMDANVDGGVLTVCMHPQVIGRAHRIAMLDRFVAAGHDLGVSFQTLGNVARGLTDSEQP